MIHLLRPWWLLTIIPGIIILLFCSKQKKLQSNWHKICDSHLLAKLLVNNKTNNYYNIFLILLSIFWILTSIILAGPTWSKLSQEVYQPKFARVIALELSANMTDDKLAIATHKIREILTKSQHMQTALVVFSAVGLHITPLTEDTATINNFLGKLHPSIMPVPGNNPAAGISKAQDILKLGNATTGEIILITDNKNTKKLKSKFPVITLDVDNYEYADLKFLNNTPNPTSGTKTKYTAGFWQDHGAKFILLLLPLALIGFRRGVIFMFACTILILPQDSFALSWEDLWLNSSQLNNKIYHPGNSAYQLKKYPTAVKIFSSGNDRYNLANSLAKNKQFKEAIDEYTTVLKINPEDKDAKFNKELIEKLLEKNKDKKQEPKPEPESKQPNKPEQDPWLNKIADDPGGLLRAKLLLQYHTSQGK